MELKVVRLRPTARQAEARIRALALGSSNVVVTLHAEERMEERGITDRDLFRILLTGSVTEAPGLTDGLEWKCKVVKRIRGSRDAGVVTVIAKDSKLIVVTVEWED